jgi:hypothetical protein
MKKNTNMNTKKYIAVGVIIAILLGFIISRNSFKKAPVEIPVSDEQLLKLPENWSKVDDTAVALKLQKKVDKGLKPEIVLIKSESKDALTPAKYTDRLIAGARSAISSLRITDDKRNASEGNYSAMLSGYYFNNKTKISLLQRVYIKGETVNTLTASFTGDIAVEANQVMDSIVKEKLAL